MFEALCVLLLRLYPSGFRRAYGPEAVQLVRDRARDERGALRRVRLLIDLAVDLCTTVMRGWHQDQPLVTRLDGAPRFDIIETGAPRPEALAAGMVTSMLLFASFGLLFQARTPPTTPARLGASSGPDTPAVASNDAAQAVAVDPDARHKLIAALATTLAQRYFDKAIGQGLADALLAHDGNGEYDSIEAGPDLAARLNRDIQTASRNLGLARGAFVADVVYSAQPLPTGPPPPMTADMRERNRAALRQQNCLFESIEMLPRGAGYVKLNGFAEPSACQEATARAMASLNGADALILDLRDNGGGFGETALQIAGYLFNRPAYMYDPRPRSPVPARTASPVSGNTLADKPVYVLTSARTQSAAEYFAYNLKMLKRATIVGETTAGHQHSGAFHRVTDHFGIGIQEVAPPDNPYPVKGWELIGVEPDVKVSRTEALDAAKTLAANR